MAVIHWSAGLEEDGSHMSIILCAKVVGVELSMSLIDTTRARRSVSPKRIEQVLVCMVRELQEEADYECDAIDMMEMAFRGEARLN